MAHDGPVIFFLLLGANIPMLVALGLALYLTAIELHELKPSYHWWMWWLLLVLMTHFVGYLVLRVYAFYTRRQAKRARS